MKCNNCGFESEQDFEYCMNCGAAAADKNAVPVEAASLNPAADKVMNALKDRLFLVICILMTAACGLSLIGGDVALIHILITIFLWLTYADAQKGFANERHLRSVSGAVYANYIILNVIYGIYIVCGVLIGLIFSLIDIDSMVEIRDLLEEMSAELGISMADTGIITQQVLAVAGWIVGIFVIIISIIALVINILGMRKIHRFAKSVYMGIMLQNPEFENPKTAKNWILVYGIFNGISALYGLIASNVLVTISAGALAAAGIIASILIGKYFTSENQYV